MWYITSAKYDSDKPSLENGSDNSKSQKKSIIKAVWAFSSFLFLPFPLPPIISHSAKHNLRSSKAQITGDSSIVFYSALWH